MSPKFSVCIPNYNGGRFIAATIESALAQNVSSQDLEVIISDNGSSDNSVDIIKSFTPRIRLVLRAETIPVIEHWNACLQEARGEYCLLLHSDDLIDPDFLTACRDVFDSDSRIQMVSSLGRVIDGTGSLIKLQPPRDAPRSSPIQVLLRGNCVMPPSLLVRRSFYSDVRPYDPSIMYCADYDLAVRAAAINGLAFLDRYLCSYRRHGSNQGGQDAANLLDIQHTAAAQRLWAMRLGLTRERSRELNRRMLWSTLLTTVCVLERGSRRNAAQRLTTIRKSFEVRGLAAPMFINLWLFCRVPGAWKILRLITGVYRRLSYKAA